MGEVRLKKGEEDRILRGHPWIYDNEILKVEGNPSPGAEVNVVSFSGRFLGRGFINPASKIRVRLYTRGKESLGRALIERRLREAWEYRTRVTGTETCRAAFAEADGLPGLIVDRFTDAEREKTYLVVQTLTLGMELHREEILSALTEIFHPDGIYERNDVPVRTREGLELRKGFAGEPFETGIVIRENGLLFHVDLSGGQKTGYYLDQRENRAAIAPFCRGARVLDAFSHTGGFAVHALAYGAAHATAVDISSDAVATVRRNAALNGFTENLTAIEANVFDYLHELGSREQEGSVLRSPAGAFDLIVLDPPAFAKSRSTLDAAYRGYKEINLRAMKLLPPGGVLVTCSCSQAMDLSRFREMALDAAVDAGRSVREVELRRQAKDHPILYGYDESFYLKCLILEIR